MKFFGHVTAFWLAFGVSKSTTDAYVMTQPGLLKSSFGSRTRTGSYASVSSRTTTQLYLDMPWKDLSDPRSKQHEYIEDYYANWCRAYGKRFDPNRFDVFKQNLEEMRSYQSKNGWRKMEMNEYSDLTKTEYSQMMGSSPRTTAAALNNVPGSGSRREVRGTSPRDKPINQMHGTNMSLEPPPSSSSSPRQLSNNSDGRRVPSLSQRQQQSSKYNNPSSYIQDPIENRRNQPFAYNRGDEKEFDLDAQTRFRNDPQEPPPPPSSSRGNQRPYDRTSSACVDQDPWRKERDLNDRTDQKDFRLDDTPRGGNTSPFNTGLDPPSRTSNTNRMEQNNSSASARRGPLPRGSPEYDPWRKEREMNDRSDQKNFDLDNPMNRLDSSRPEPRYGNQQQPRQQSGDYDPWRKERILNDRTDRKTFHLEDRPPPTRREPSPVFNRDGDPQYDPWRQQSEPYPQEPDEDRSWYAFTPSTSSGRQEQSYKQEGVYRDRQDVRRTRLEAQEQEKEDRYTRNFETQFSLDPPKPPRAPPASLNRPSFDQRPPNDDGYTSRDDDSTSRRDPWRRTQDTSKPYPSDNLEARRQQEDMLRQQEEFDRRNRAQAKEDTYRSNFETQFSLDPPSAQAPSQGNPSQIPSPPMSADGYPRGTVSDTSSRRKSDPWRRNSPSPDEPAEPELPSDPWRKQGTPATPPNRNIGDRARGLWNSMRPGSSKKRNVPPLEAETRFNSTDSAYDSRRDRMSPQDRRQRELLESQFAPEQEQEDRTDYSEGYPVNKPRVTGTTKGGSRRVVDDAPTNDPTGDVGFSLDSRRNPMKRKPTGAARTSTGGGFKQYASDQQDPTARGTKPMTPSTKPNTFGKSNPWKRSADDKATSKASTIPPRSHSLRDDNLSQEPPTQRTLKSMESEQDARLNGPWPKRTTTREEESEQSKLGSERGPNFGEDGYDDYSGYVDYEPSQQQEMGVRQSGIPPFQKYGSELGEPESQDNRRDIWNRGGTSDQAPSSQRSVPQGPTGQSGKTMKSSRPTQASRLNLTDDYKKFGGGSTFPKSNVVPPKSPSAFKQVPLQAPPGEVVEQRQMTSMRPNTPGDSLMGRTTARDQIMAQRPSGNVQGGGRTKKNSTPQSIDARLRTIYEKWCRQYGKEMSEDRFPTFKENFVAAEEYQKTSGKPMELDGYSDLSIDEYMKLKDQKTKAPSVKAKEAADAAARLRLEREEADRLAKVQRLEDNLARQRQLAAESAARIEGDHLLEKMRQKEEARRRQDEIERLEAIRVQEQAERRRAEEAVERQREEEARRLEAARQEQIRVAEEALRLKEEEEAERRARRRELGLFDLEACFKAFERGATTSTGFDSSFSTNKSKRKLRHAYIKWCEFYDKKYDESRLKIFEANAKLAESSVGMKLNEYADRTVEEFHEMMGLPPPASVARPDDETKDVSDKQMPTIPSSPSSQSGKFMYTGPPANATIPGDAPYAPTPVHDQGDIGSSSSFSVAPGSYMDHLSSKTAPTTKPESYIYQGPKKSGNVPSGTTNPPYQPPAPASQISPAAASTESQQPQGGSSYMDHLSSQSTPPKKSSSYIYQGPTKASATTDSAPTVPQQANGQSSSYLDGVSLQDQQQQQENNDVDLKRLTHASMTNHDIDAIRQAMRIIYGTSKQIETNCMEGQAFTDPENCPSAEYLMRTLPEWLYPYFPESFYLDIERGS